MFGFLFVSGIIISYLINIIIGSSAFYITNARGVISMVEQFKSFLTGRLIPLNALPQLGFLIFQPFSFLFFIPLTVFTNEINTNDYSRIILGSIISIITLYLIAFVFYSRGIRRYEGIGI